MEILAIDCLSSGRAHFHFNATIIAAVYRIPEVRSIIFAGEKRHVSHICKMLVTEYDTMSVIGEKLWADKKNSKNKLKRGWSILQRYCHSFLLIRRLKPDLVIFMLVESTLWPIFILSINLISRFLSSQNIWVILHNNLANLIKNNIKQNLWRMMGQFSPLNFLVLTERMLNHSNRLFKPSKLHLLKHPIMRRKVSNNLDLKDNFICFNGKTIRLIILGRQAKIAIETEFLSEISDECDRILNETGVRFKIFVQSFQTQDRNLNLSENISFIKKSLNDQQYLFQISDAHFVIFPCNWEVDFRPSGTFLDAIAMGTPVIAPRKGHFVELISENGRVRGGYLYDEKYPLASVLRRAANVSSEAYNQMCCEIKEFSASLSLEQTIKRIRTLITLNYDSFGKRQ